MAIVVNVICRGTVGRRSNECCLDQIVERTFMITKRLILIIPALVLVLIVTLWLFAGHRSDMPVILVAMQGCQLQADEQWHSAADMLEILRNRSITKVTMCRAGKILNETWQETVNVFEHQVTVYLPGQHGYVADSNAARKIAEEELAAEFHVNIVDIEKFNIVLTNEVWVLLGPKPNGSGNLIEVRLSQLDDRILSLSFK